MKNTFATFLTTATVLAPLAAGAETLRTSIHFPDTHVAVVTAQKLSEALSVATGGALMLDIYPNSSLGGLSEAVDQLRAGLNDVDMSGPEIYSATIPEMTVLSLPFIASSTAQAKCLVDGELGDYLEAKAEAQGLKVLGWWASGARNVTNSRQPITKLEDIAGLRIRTPPNATYLETFRALGANPMSIDISETYQAMQQQLIDGQENPYSNIATRKFYEVQGHVSNTGHFFAYTWFLMNKASFDNLDAAEQTALQAEIDKITPQQWADADAANKASLETLIDNGMTYTEIAPEELARMREATLPIYEAARASVGDEALDKLMVAIDHCSKS